MALPHYCLVRFAVPRKISSTGVAVGRITLYYPRCEPLTCMVSVIGLASVPMETLETIATLISHHIIAQASSSHSTPLKYIRPVLDRRVQDP